MVDLMGLFLELMTNIIVLVTKTFLLLKLVCLFCARTICVVIHTWLELVKVIFDSHVDICWRIIIWTVALVSLPVHILTALQRERLLEMHLHETQIDLVSLAWDKKDIEERLRIAIQDYRIIESILTELEEEHDKAIAKIELLENELQDLKDKNLRLNEILWKGLWNFEAQDEPGCSQIVRDKDKYGIPLVTKYDIPAWNSGYNGSGVVIQDLLKHRHAWEENKGEVQPHDILNIESKGSRPMYPFPPRIIHRSLTVDEVLEQRRGAALSQSLFSAILSLLVGMIIWEAEDPCMPLVVALFTVVGMSLVSVVQFFSTIKNRPASDAVALLSFNWFILGMLTYPALPKVAHMLAPMALSLTDPTVNWLGLS